MVRCKKCKSNNIKVFEDKVREDQSLCICQNKNCANTGMKYEFDKGE